MKRTALLFLVIVLTIYGIGGCSKPEEDAATKTEAVKQAGTTEMKETLSKAAEDVKNQVMETTQKYGEKIQETKDTLTDEIEKKVDEVKEEGQEMMDKVMPTETEKKTVDDLLKK